VVSTFCSSEFVSMAPATAFDSRSGNKSIFLNLHTGQEYSRDLQHVNHPHNFDGGGIILLSNLSSFLGSEINSTNSPVRYIQLALSRYPRGNKGKQPFVGKNPISPINAVRTIPSVFPFLKITREREMGGGVIYLPTRDSRVLHGDY
jgi:hypothetical protein